MNQFSGSLVQKHSQQDFGMPYIIIQLSSSYNAHPEERVSQISLLFDFFLKVETRKGTVQSFGPQRYATGYVKPKRHTKKLLLSTKDKMKIYKELNRLIHSPMLLPWLLDVPRPAGRSSIDTKCASSSRSTL